MLTDVIRLLLFPALMAFAASSDLLTMTISNRLSLALPADFFCSSLVTGISLYAIGMHLAAGTLVLVFAFAFFSRAGLAAAMPSSPPPPRSGSASILLDYLVYASLFGGALTLAILQFRKMPLPGMLRQSWIVRLHETDGGIPYGIALPAAALAVYPKTGWMPAWHLKSAP